MTNEDQQRTMDFILQQQAQMAVHIQQLEEDRIRDQPRLASVERSFKRLDDLFDRVVKLAEITDYRLDRLESITTAHETRTAVHEANMAAIERNMAALAEVQAHTDNKLGALIDIVQQDRDRPRN